MCLKRCVSLLCCLIFGQAESAAEKPEVESF